MIFRAIDASSVGIAFAVACLLFMQRLDVFVLLGMAAIGYGGSVLVSGHRYRDRPQWLDPLYLLAIQAVMLTSYMQTVAAR